MCRRRFAVVIEHEFGIVGPGAIRPAIEIQLQDALERPLINADLQLLNPVLANDLPNVGIGIVIPILEDPADVLV